VGLVPRWVKEYIYHYLLLLSILINWCFVHDYLEVSFGVRLNDWNNF
jgi:hypothetical protein